MPCLVDHAPYMFYLPLCVSNCMLNQLHNLSFYSVPASLTCLTTKLYELSCFNASWSVNLDRSFWPVVFLINLCFTCINTLLTETVYYNNDILVSGSPVILGKGTKVFASGANMSMVCEYNSSSMLTQSDIQKLKFYDKGGNEYDGTRNFMQSYSMISSNKIATTLTKESLDRPDAGTYQCRYDNQEATKFLVTVAIVECKYNVFCTTLLISNSMSKK